MIPLYELGYIVDRHAIMIIDLLHGGAKVIYLQSILILLSMASSYYVAVWRIGEEAMVVLLSH